uniref:Hematopoietic cell signal transducer n=1 Tax=Leptobrachium leishanense TaxID=445787 RepID=A0A8C5R2F6_9ANUR
MNAEMVQLPVRGVCDTHNAGSVHSTVLYAGCARSSDSDTVCGNCYHIDNITLAGVVIGDILLTIIIILVVYFCTKQTYQKRASPDDKKIYMNMPSR